MKYEELDSYMRENNLFELEVWSADFHLATTAKATNVIARKALPKNQTVRLVEPFGRYSYLDFSVGSDYGHHFFTEQEALAWYAEQLAGANKVIVDRGYTYRNKAQDQLAQIEVKMMKNPKMRDMLARQRAEKLEGSNR